MVIWRLDTLLFVQEEANLDFRPVNMVLVLSDLWFSHTLKKQCDSKCLIMSQ